MAKAPISVPEAPFRVAYVCHPFFFVGVNCAGKFEGDFEGNFEGNCERHFEGNFEGNVDGNCEGNFEGTFEGNVEGARCVVEKDMPAAGVQPNHRTRKALTAPPRSEH